VRYRNAKNLLLMGTVKVISIILAAITNIFLAIFLSSIDFGIVSTLLVIVGTISQFNDFGLFSAAVQLKNLDKNTLVSLFTIRFLIGISVFIFIFISAPYIALLLKIKNDAVVIQLLAVEFVFTAFSFIPSVIFSRKLKFKLIAIIQFINGVTYSIIAIALAYYGFGFMSIIAGLIVSTIITSLLYFLLYRWNFELSFKIGRIIKQLHFGFTTFLGNFIWYISNTVIVLSLLYILGIAELGNYRVAVIWALFIPATLGPVLHNVLFPAYSKHQNDPQKLSIEVFNIIKFISFIILPATLGLMVISSPFIILILSGNTTKWIHITIIFRLLIIYAILQVYVTPFPTVFLSMGKAKEILYINTLTLVSFLIFIPYFTYRFGITGTGIGIIIGYLPNLFLYIILSKKLIPIPFKEIFINIRKSILFSIVMSIIVYLVVIAVANNYINLLIEIMIGTFIYFALSYLFNREIFQEFSNVLFKSAFLGKIHRE
jgi:lipopolysaccharide exporter